ncbi:MAG: hypothetical protein IT307_04315 [Chloroflexi bacterium]|nr:hypothetical protein [Chloroflexota bacterium]
MAIVRGEADVLTADGTVIGSGMAYLHLPRGRERAQTGTGTVSLRDWSPLAGSPEVLRVASCPAPLRIAVERDELSDCSRNRILRLAVEWPGIPEA